ncbi:MAG: hypothetical protein FMNOHCHN_02057 [Ignavibacteriaceae bacterium]|nr:hypothetical protein [Ignavibacteriaceae bacterium]
MLITRIHPFTGQTNTKDLPITREEMDRWESGELIQNVWPHLSDDDREFILTGITDWDARIPQELGVLPQESQEILAANNDGIPASTEPEYRPPSSRIYSTSNVATYKFHKLRPVLKYLNENIYLAGGSLRTILKCSGEIVSDFDFFFKNFEEVLPLRNRLEQDCWENVYECPQGFLYTYKKGNHKLQLICETEYSSANLLVSSFDVSACMCCWHEGILTFTREFVRSVKTKHLRTCNVTFPVATIKRLIKYAQKGYNCSMASEDFCRQISGKSFVGDEFRHYID